MSLKRDKNSNSGYVRNGKPDIVMKTVKGFHIKKTPFMILMQENSLKFEIIVLVMLNKMLVIVFTIDFYS